MKATIVLYASIFSSNYYDLGTELTSIKVITGIYYFCDFFLVLQILSACHLVENSGYHHRFPLN